MVDTQFLKLLQSHTDSLNDRRQFSGLLKDLMPGMALQSNLLLNLYDLDIHNEISKATQLDNSFIYRFTKQLCDDYGVSKRNADWAVATWCSCYGESILGKTVETASNVEDDLNVDEIRTEVVATTFDVASNDYIDDWRNVYEYEVESDGVIIKKYVAFDTDEVTIPNHIEGYPVVRIGESAFEKCGIKRIFLPDSINSIGKSAFSMCDVESIVLPDGLRYIADSAFSGCSFLKQIYLPSSLRHIGCAAFSSSGISSIEIPNGVQEISSNAFSSCKNLSHVKLPKNLKVIDNYGFANCSMLAQVDIPAGTTRIGANAFSVSKSIFRDEGLYRIRIPNSVIEFGGTIVMYERYKNGNVKRSWSGYSDLVFDGVTYIYRQNLTVYCNPGSDALKYARAKGIKVDKYENY